MKAPSPGSSAAAPRERPVRTYVAYRYAGPPLFGRRPPGEVELDPLGTVDATTPDEARALAGKTWPGLPPRAIRVRTARAAGAGALAVALANDARAQHIRDAGARRAPDGDRG